jgi:hypothetical protein
LGLLGGLGASALARTTDAGATWTAITLPAGYSGSTIDAFAFSGSYAWFASQAGEIARSTDAGLTWTLEKKLTSNGLFCFSVSNNNMWVSGYEGTIMKGQMANSYSLTLNFSALLEAMYVSGGSAMTMSPSVTIELHGATTPYAMVESQTATLNTAGIGAFTFTTAANGTPYYIVIKYLNTVETWSATAQSFTNNLLTYDFTSGLGQAFTDGSNPPLALHSGKYCIYSGDDNHDGFVSGDDYTGVDNDNSNFSYDLVYDINGDGFVSGDDFTFIDNNNSSFIQIQAPSGATIPLAKRVLKHQIQQKISVVK